MRQIAIIITTLIVPTFLSGQVKSVNIPDKIINNKNIDFRQFEKQRCAEFNLKLLSIDTTSFDEYYRITDRKQIIEVWKIDTNFGGQVINFTRTHDDSENSEKKKSELIYNNVNISADTSKIIMEKIKCLDSIPDMEKIKGWGIGFDGVTYFIESSTKKEYSIKSYWSPVAQNDSVAYKNEIIAFTRLIYKELNLFRHFEEFTNGLPNGSYTNGFGIMTIAGRKKTKKKN